MTTTLAEHMMLDIIRTGLKDLTPPAAPHDPAGDWQLCYNVYTLAGDCDKAGSLTLTREALGRSQHRLMLSARKLQTAGAHQVVEATMECKTDALGTPLHWEWDVDFLKADDQSWPGMALAKKGRTTAQGYEIHYATPSRVCERNQAPAAARAYAASGPLALSWGLWEAIGRLPREAGPALEFTLVEDFDQCKIEQKLMYQKSIELAWPEGAADAQPWRLHAFDHLGRGIVPFTYWVDGAGRLVAAVSGIEAYILDTTEA